MKYINNAGLEYEVLSRVGNDCVVRFTQSGSVRKAKSYNFSTGKVKDLYAPSRYGIGYDGDIDKTVPYWKKAKDLWSNMLKRCYYLTETGYPYYKDTVVDVRWHCFSNFLNDLPKLVGFKDWVANKRMELDKDIMSGSTKVYSKDTCMFVSAFTNRSIQPNYRLNKTFCTRTQSWINAHD